MSTKKKNYDNLDFDNTPKKGASSWLPKVLAVVIIIGLAILMFGKRGGTDNGQIIPEDTTQNYGNDTNYTNSTNSTIDEEQYAEPFETPVFSEFEILRTYERPDPQYYTQGLTFIDKDTLIESAGLYKESEIHFIDIESMQTRKNVKNNGEVFGEGCEVFDNGEKVIQLTWMNNKMYIYSKDTLKNIQEVKLPPAVKEGWGISRRDVLGVDDQIIEELWVSDGTSNLHVMDPKTYQVIRTISVYQKKNGEKVAVPRLNELEFIEGKLWANIYTTNYIAVINPDTGFVERLYNMERLEKLAKEKAREKTSWIKQGEVLNGIAYYQLNKRLILTGKKWPLMWEIGINGLNQ